MLRVAQNTREISIIMLYHSKWYYDGVMNTSNVRSDRSHRGIDVLGERLRSLRKELGFSQQELAKRVKEYLGEDGPAYQSSISNMEDQEKHAVTVSLTPLTAAPTLAASEIHQHTFMPSLAVAPTPNAAATAQVLKATIEATAKAQQIIASATQVAQGTAAVATQEAGHAAALATLTAQRVTAPPADSDAWCANNEVRSVCVNGFRYKKDFSYYEASPGERYIGFGVTVRNVSQSTISVNPLHVTLVMSDGQTYALSAETFAFWQHPLDAVEVAPGDNAYGGVLFLTSDSVAPERIIYRGGFLESEITIDLTSPPHQ
jgi:transcriptional regulator with XRE-family HTH domain